MSREGRGPLPFGFTFDLSPYPARSVRERRRVVERRPVQRREDEIHSWTGEEGMEKSERGEGDGLIEAGMMFNSKKLKTRPANYGASRAINPEEDWTK